MTEKQQPRKTKRPMSAREMAAKFNVSERSVRKWGHNPEQTILQKTASVVINHGNTSAYLA